MEEHASLWVLATQIINWLILAAASILLLLAAIGTTRKETSLFLEAK